jgi:hypothetical protein
LIERKTPTVPFYLHLGYYSYLKLEALVCPFLPSSVVVEAHLYLYPSMLQ